MRVLHICPYMHATAGGPPVVVERLSSLMKAEGWDASIITTSLYCEDQGQELQRVLSANLNVRVLPISGFQMLRRAGKASDAIDEAVRKSDVVHLHTLWNPLTTTARRACQRHDRRYVLMPHGMLDPYSLRQKAWRKKLYLAVVERTNIKNASRLIFTTAQEQKNARASLPRLPLGDIITLGADYPPDASHEDLFARFTQRFPETRNRRCLLFLGRIHPKKGLETLLMILPDVIRKHADAMLIVAGSGDARYVASIKRLVEESGLEQQVLFTGMLTGDAKYEALARADIFLLPSKQENFAIAVAEAMHMAIPVIITDKVDSWPLVRMANAGFVVEENHIDAGFLRRINELLSNPDVARAFGRRGQRFARAELTWNRVAKDMAAVYQGVLAG